MVRFGSSLRLYSEALFLRELEPLGMSPKGFRALLASLSVPYIEIGNTRFVDGYSFFLALRSILRIGQKNFLAPGSLDRNTGQRSPDRHTTSLDLAYFRDNFHAIACDLLYSQKLNGLSITEKEVLDAASETARRMLAASLQSLPPRALARYDRRAIANISRLLPGLFESPETQPNGTPPPPPI